MTKTPEVRKRHLDKTPHRRQKQLRKLEELALEQGYQPGELTMTVMSDNARRLMSWYEFLKAGTVPAEMSNQSSLRDAWNMWYQEVAAFMQVEERWMEYFQGKIQRVEADLSVEEKPKVVSAEPLDEDEWQQEYSLGAPEGAAKGSGGLPDR